MIRPIKPTRAQRRAKYAEEGIPGKLMERVVRFRDAQSRRLQTEFARTAEGAALQKRSEETADRVNKLTNGRQILIKEPRSVDAETRKMLSNPKNKKTIVECYESRVRFYEGALDFIKKQRGTYKSHIQALEQIVEMARKDLSSIKAALQQY